MADNLCLLEGNYAKHGDIEIDEDFPNTLVMSIIGKGTPWYADYANYVASGILPEGISYHLKK